MDYSFDDDSLFNAIKEHKKENPNIKLVVLDCLNKLSGSLNVNDTTQMNKFSLFKRKTFSSFPDITIIWVHHISEHKHRGLSFVDFMNENTSGLAMGSSVVTQQADSIIVVAPKIINKGKLIELGVRPITKRVRLETGCFIVKLKQTEKMMIFNYEEKYELDLLNDVMRVPIYKDMKYAFKVGGTNKKKQSLSVLNMYDSLKSKYGMTRVRTALKELESMKLIKCLTKKPYAFEYVWVEQSKKPKKTTPASKQEISEITDIRDAEVWG